MAVGVDIPPQEGRIVHDHPGEARHLELTEDLEVLIEKQTLLAIPRELECGNPLGGTDFDGRVEDDSKLLVLVVVVGWVIFRAGSFSAAIRMLSAMFDISTLAADYDAFPIVGGEVNAAVTCVVLAWLACWYAPNTLQIMSTFSTALETFEKPRFPRYGLNLRWSLILSVLFVASIVHISRSGKFLYFDF